MTSLDIAAAVGPGTAAAVRVQVGCSAMGEGQQHLTAPRLEEGRGLAAPKRLGEAMGEACQFHGAEEGACSHRGGGEAEHWRSCSCACPVPGIVAAGYLDGLQCCCDTAMDYTAAVGACENRQEGEIT